MELLAIIGIVAVAALVGGGFLVTLFGRSKYEQGKNDAQIEDDKAASAAKDRANVVLGEHRDPSDVDKRLRDGSF